MHCQLSLSPVVSNFVEGVAKINRVLVKTTTITITKSMRTRVQSTMLFCGNTQWREFPDQTLGDDSGIYCVDSRSVLRLQTAAQYQVIISYYAKKKNPNAFETHVADNKM